MSHLVIRLYKPAKTRAIASAKIKTGKLAYEISTYLSAIETKYNDTLYEAELFAYSIVKKYGKCVAVCESTANLWLKTYQAFEKYNIGVKLANPLKTKAIAEAKIKTDTLDARTLAHLLRSDLVAECYIAPRQLFIVVIAHRDSPPER
jgi:transposase